MVGLWRLTLALGLVSVIESDDSCVDSDSQDAVGLIQSKTSVKSYLQEEGGASREDESPSDDGQSGQKKEVGKAMRELVGKALEVGNALHSPPSRGFAICMAPDEEKLLTAFVQRLEKVGNTDPIEAFHFKGEFSQADIDKFTQRLGPRVVAKALPQEKAASPDAGFSCKPYALLASSFQQVMQVDVDVVFFKDPAALWSSKEVQRTGTMFFHDRWLALEGEVTETCSVLEGMAKRYNVTLASDLAQRYPATCSKTQVPQHSVVEACTSVVLVDKARKPQLLKYLKKLHEDYFDSFYGGGGAQNWKVGYADGETVWMACELSSPGMCSFSPWRPLYMFQGVSTASSHCLAQADPESGDLLYANFMEFCQKLEPDSVSLLGDTSKYVETDWICHDWDCPQPSGIRKLTAKEHRAVRGFENEPQPLAAASLLETSSSVEPMRSMITKRHMHRRVKSMLQWDAKNMLVKTGPGWMFVTCVLLLSHVAMDSFSGGKGKSAFITTAAVWVSSSVGMSCLNKLILAVWSAPFTLLLVQMLLADTFLVAGFGLRRIGSELWSKRQDVWRWAILTIPVTGMLATSLLALQAGTLNGLIVVRGALPLVTLFFEKIFLPSSAPKITAEVIGSLVVMAVGMVLYVRIDFMAAHLSVASWSSTMPKGMFWIAANMLCTGVARIMERKMLTDDSMTLSFEAMNVVNNTVGLIPVAGLLFFCKEHRISIPLTLPLTSWSPMNFAVCGSILLSGVLGLLLGWYGIALQKQLAATSMLVLQVGSRLATILFAVTMFSESLTPVMWTGCLLSLGGCAWYSWAVRKQ